MKTVAVAAALALAGSASAASVAAYGQCGGADYSGSTTCVSGYTCTFMNDWYSQCVAGSAAASTTAKAATTLATSTKATSTKAASTTAKAATTSAKAATTSTTAKAATTTSATAVADTDAVTTICGQWDSVATGAYTLYQDLWNEDEGTGSQCSTLDSVDGSTIKWSTSWSWEDNSDQVKSYANVVTTLTEKELSSISTIDTTWDWSYTGSDIVADVSYDMFLAATDGGSDTYEIMVWLAAIGGAGPISSSGSDIATPTIGDNTFKLYSGTNGDTTVYSFVAESEITSFSGDLKEFFTYLIDSEGLSSSQYLVSIGAGTEPFTGSDAVLTSTFSCTVG